MTTRVPVVASLRTDTGQVRDHNEDFIATWEPADPEKAAELGRLFILADGAGGMDAGEIASSQATEWTLDHFRNNGEEKDPSLRLYAAMCAANDALRDLMVEQNKQGRMATTMVATVVQDSRAIIANVGDSRGYHWRDGTLRQVTRDHSLVAQLVERGVITAAEAETHPRRNVILASLGSEGTPRIELFEVELQTGDQLLMCSDGLTGHVTDEEIGAVLAEHEPDEATAHLIALANERGGTDNISVIILRIGDAPSPNGKPVTLRQLHTVELALPTAAEKRWLWIYTGLLWVIPTLLIFAAWTVLVLGDS